MYFVDKGEKRIEKDKKNHSYAYDSGSASCF